MNTKIRTLKASGYTIEVRGQVLIATRMMCCGTVETILVSHLDDLDDCFSV